MSLTSIIEINNPLIQDKLMINREMEDIDIIQGNVSKYFNKVYILCPFKSELINEEIYDVTITQELFNSLKSRLVLYQVTSRVLKNPVHFENIIITEYEVFNDFNHLGYELDDEIIVLPILNISFLNIQTYIKIFDGNNTLKDIYNLQVLNRYFNTKSSNFRNMYYISRLINNIEEANYWLYNYNCSMNISDVFSKRAIKLSEFRNLENSNVSKVLKGLGKTEIEGNYLEMIFKNKKYTDVSSIIKKKGYKLYRISKPDDITKEDVNLLFQTLNEYQKYLLFCNLVVSKKHCHLALNNKQLLNEMLPTINKHDSLFRYIIGYAWLRFYTEECIKKTYIKTTDDFVFELDIASKLPMYPFILSNPQLNPYMPILVSKDTLNPENNIGGFPSTNINNQEDIKYKNNGICNNKEFQDRLNIFCTRNKDNNIFNNIDFDKFKMAITGSIITACLQRKHPLVYLFENINGVKTDFNLLYARYFNEYYSNADIDIMIKTEDPFEFCDIVRKLHDKISDNVVTIYPEAEKSHVKLRPIKTLFLFVSENFINQVAIKNDIPFEIIISNINKESFIELFKPYFHSYFEKKITYMLKDFNDSEIEKIKEKYPDYFQLEENVCYQINIKSKTYMDIKLVKVKSSVKLDDEEVEDILLSETSDEVVIDSNIGILIAYKYKINAPQLDHELEIFPIRGDDFFCCVSTFHLPCVRGYWNGTTAYLLPSCISAHMTYMNIDYKYFAGKRDPFEIINKYRMRGFGTWLNRKEIGQFMEYSSKILFWNNLYRLDLKNKNSVSKCLGFIDITNLLYRPRLYNGDYFIDAFPIPYENAYKEIMEKVKTIKSVDEYNSSLNFKDRTSLIMLHKMSAVNTTTGYVNPLKKNMFELYYNDIKHQNIKDIIKDKKSEVWIDPSGNKMNI